MDEHIGFWWSEVKGRCDPVKIFIFFLKHTLDIVDIELLVIVFAPFSSPSVSTHIM